MLKNLKGLLTPPIIIGATVVIAIIVVIGAYISTESKPSGAFVTPTMGPLVQEVDTTGSVQAADEINLGFQVSGTVSYAGPAVGTHVGQGATLGTLTSGTQQAAVEQAQAALAMQEANLSAVQAGATPQTLAVSQTAVANAQASLAQAQQSLLAVAQDAYAKSDDAISNKVDQFIENPNTSSPTLAFNLTNSQDQASIISGQLQMQTLLNNWQEYLAALPSDPGQIDTSAIASTTRTDLEAVSAYLSLVATGLTEVAPNSSYPTATIQGYQSNVATGRTNVSTDLSSIDSAEAGVTTTESALASAQSQLTLAQAPATSQSLDAQQAQVASAQASVDAAKAVLAQTVISAPISGTVTVNNMEPGQIATAGQTQISMISDSAFQFQTYVSEADLANIKVGDSAEVELDAYQDQPPLSAQVIEINPAATIQNGVSSYEIKLQFDENDPRISSGETGSVKIITQSLTNVMSVPTSAIIMNNGQYFVIAKTPSGTQEVPVQIGIQSAGGYTQIVSGLTSDEEVQAFGTQQ
jgi:RND family efflux transporter MFP subunit